jgi:uncharacterized integral membrane protein
MQKVWAVLRMLVLVALVLLFARNTHPVTFYSYLGYSSTLPLFLWLALCVLSGIILGYSAARIQFWSKSRSSRSRPEEEDKASQNKEPSIPSLVDAIRAVPSSPKGEDEHGHYGI